MEKAPPPAIRITVGVPLLVQYKCSLRRPMSIKRPGGGYDTGDAFCCMQAGVVNATMTTAVLRSDRTGGGSPMKRIRRLNQESSIKTAPVQRRMRVTVEKSPYHSVTNAARSQAQGLAF